MPELVYLWTTPKQRNGYKWLLTKGLPEHSWTWAISMSKERESRSTMSQRIWGTKPRNPRERNELLADLKVYQR